MAADNRAAKSTNDAEETITVVADGAQRHQRLSAAQLRHRDANLDAAAGYSPGGQYRERSGSRRSAHHLTDEALYNVANVVQTNTLGGTPQHFCLVTIALNVPICLFDSRQY